MIKKISEKQIYSDAWLKLFQDVIVLPNGEKSTYAYVQRKNGVAIVVVSVNNKILLHKEHRYVIQNYSWEIQGGGVDDGESISDAAIRELKEEAGITINSTSLISLGSFYPLHSFNTEKVSLFMVITEGEIIQKISTEVGEHLTDHRFFNFDEIYAMIDSGKINDAMTANAVQLAIRKKLNK